MAVGVQQIGDRLVTAWTRYSGDGLDIEAIHSSQRRMIKRKRMRNRLIDAGTRRADFSPRAKTNFYIKRARQMGKSLITANTQ